MFQSQVAKLFLGVSTLLPLVYVAYFFWRTSSALGSSEPWFDMDEFDVLIRLHVAMALLTFCLLVFYIVHLFRTPFVESDKKALWGIVLIFGSVLAMVVYWALYVWSTPPRLDASASGMD